MQDTQNRLPSFFGLRLALVAALWIGLERLLALQAYRVVPASLGASLSLASWMAFIEFLSTLLGLLLSLALLHSPGKLSLPQEALGALLPRRLSWLHALLLAPLVYVTAIYLGQQAALETLLAEIRQGGRQQAQAGLGDFGAGLAVSSLVATLAWVGLMAPISEELMFRGAMWGAIQRGVDWLRPSRRKPSVSAFDAAMAAAQSDLDAPPPSSAAVLSGSVISDPAWFKLLRGTWRAILDGFIATLVVLALFTAMHADFDTGLGIIRVVSALVLGFFCGIFRQWSGGVLAPIVLHASFNWLSVATDHRWVVSDSFPKWKLVPSLLVYVGFAGLALSCIVLFVEWQLRRSTQST
ncbi:MAG: CPBP family glutamic-type intramembrane protease [Polyangiaceae bacterium]